MIKGIVLDVDGVIVGETRGLNSPHPHPEVIKYLREVRKSGMPITLCTAKAVFGIEYEIKEMELKNPHIADGGSLLVDENVNVLKKCLLDGETAHKMVRTLIENDIYVEVYTASNYYIQKNQLCDMTKKHELVMECLPETVESLDDFCQGQEVTKLAVAVPNEEAVGHAKAVLAEFEDAATISWTKHPSILPIQFAVITAPNISKRQGVIDIAEMLDIPLENLLGVGDSKSDWQFIELCGYGAAMGNAGEDLKELVRSKGDKGYVGKGVDDNGVIDIIKHFLS